MNMNGNERSSNSRKEGSHTMDEQDRDGEGESATTIRCEQCGHEIPTENMALHRAACHSNHHHHHHTITTTTSSMNHYLFPSHTASSHNEDGHVNNHASVMTAPASPPPPPPPETVRCTTCGKQISALSAMVHEATCHRQQVQEVEGDNNNSNNNSRTARHPLEQPPEAVEVPALGQQEQETLSPILLEPSANSSRSQSESSQNQEQEQEWACPRCTLLNDPTELYCQACGFFSGGRGATIGSNPTRTTTTRTTTTTTQPATIRVEVREVDPRYVTAATTAGSILSWTALGALVAGPVGAAVGGVGAALAAAAVSGGGGSSNNNNNQSPHFSFTSTRITPTGATTTRYVTRSNNNAAGSPSRTVIIRAPDGVFNGGSVADRMIFQMLVLNALNQGATNADQMTYEELLQRFGVGSEHRGASQESIHALPLTKLDNTAIEALNENQKTCNICLEDLKEGDEMRKLPDCSHVFHRQCIDEWLGRVASCPICKKEIQRQPPSAEERQTMESPDDDSLS